MLLLMMMMITWKLIALRKILESIHNFFTNNLVHYELEL
jgi:hypothetical protein